MGNVLAATSPPPPPTTYGVPPMSTKDDSVGKVDTSTANDLNPGPMEDLHKKCKDVFPMPFDGARLVITKGLSNHFQLSHNITMSNGVTVPPGYRFGATYIGTKQISPTEAYPILYGEMDPSGNLNSRLLHLIGDRLKLQIGAQIQDSKCVSSQLTTDYRGRDFTASMTFGNIDPINLSGVVVSHYLQNVTPNVALGGELAYQCGPHVPGNEVAVLSLAGRYTSPNNYILSGTLSNSGAHLCYYQKGGENIQVGVEVETNLRMMESTASFGYQVDLPKANLVFRGMVDTNWTVGAVLEKKLLPLPFTFALSGQINHIKHATRIGAGLYLG
ncbi:mitochondrial import receptor subunit TOM40 homolog 1-like [Oppia nitens]|uniref:mitochondrial import receptor subunit TOM40 homolog 1-like n=1 Tax=Oppia nitens TaxID=1686743 RepID=UPI0023DA8DE0|nr:mitochondrial import receptor subunit TOM40 homolog 1-like [Oppia nitens]XP_054164363.1 mitochondrial import receptor subunit TOM40 homolog 1-like [Oppia nitens]